MTVSDMFWDEYKLVLVYKSNQWYVYNNTQEINRLKPKHHTCRRNTSKLLRTYTYLSKRIHKAEVFPFQLRLLLLMLLQLLLLYYPRKHFCALLFQTNTWCLSYQLIFVDLFVRLIDLIKYWRRQSWNLYNKHHWSVLKWNNRERIYFVHGIFLFL